LIKAVCYTLSYLNETDVDPMGHLRLVSPLTQAGVELIQGVSNGRAIPENVLKGDVVVIQRHFPSLYNQYREIVELARQGGKPIVYEIDDWLLGLPEEHPDRLHRFYTPSLLPILEAIIEADLVTVPTEALRAQIIPLNSRVLVLPNYFDDTLWQFREISHPISENDQVIIGYMGTPSHRPDIDSLTPVLMEMLHRYPARVQLYFWGIEPPSLLQSFSQVKYFPWHSYCYREFAEYFQKQNADICIAPLADNPFNRCKSPLKFFEYSALGVPSIFSAIEPYINTIEDGVNGLLARTIEDWRVSLMRLIEDSNLRFHLARNAQDSIREKWLLSKSAHQWKQAYEMLLVEKLNDQNNLKHQSSIQSFIQSVNVQLFDLLQHQTQTINSQRMQLSNYEQELENYKQEIENYKQEIENYKQEVISYVMSRSWRYTRPLRKLSRFLRIG